MAHSHTLRTRGVRFVFGVAAASCNTRFQAACWALPGPDLHLTPVRWRRRPVATATLSTTLAYRACLPISYSNGLHRVQCRAGGRVVETRASYRVCNPLGWGAKKNWVFVESLVVPAPALREILI